MRMRIAHLIVEALLALLPVPAWAEQPRQFFTARTTPTKVAAAMLP